MSIVANPHFRLCINNKRTPVGQDSLYRLRVCGAFELAKGVIKFGVEMITTGVNSFYCANIKVKIIGYCLHCTEAILQKPNNIIKLDCGQVVRTLCPNGINLTLSLISDSKINIMNHRLSNGWVKQLSYLWFC